MKIADPERGFRKMREDIRRRREEQERTVYRPQQQSAPTNNNYSNNNSSAPVTDNSYIQNQLNSIQNQINNLQRPIQQPIQSPVPQVIQKVEEKPKEVSLTGLGFMGLFLTGVMYYLYQIDTLFQSNVDKLLINLPITHNLFFVGCAVISACLFIYGVFRKR